MPPRAAFFNVFSLFLLSSPTRSQTALALVATARLAFPRPCMRYRCQANSRVTSTASPRPAPASRALHRPSRIHGLPPALAHRALCIDQDASMASLLLRLAALCIGQAASTASRLLLLAALCIGQDTSMASLLLRLAAPASLLLRLARPHPWPCSCSPPARTARGGHCPTRGEICCCCFRRASCSGTCPIHGAKQPEEVRRH
jgi:hypothetical protein